MRKSVKKFCAVLLISAIWLSGCGQTDNFEIDTSALTPEQEELYRDMAAETEEENVAETSSDTGAATESGQASESPAAQNEETEPAEGEEIDKEELISEVRVGLVGGVFASARTKSSERASEEESSSDNSDRPGMDDFSWGAEMDADANYEQAIPGTVPLSDFTQYGGDWKAMIISAEEGAIYYALLNMNIDVQDEDNVNLTADWYESFAIDANTEEELKYYDESQDADILYEGMYVSDLSNDDGWDDNLVLAWDFENEEEDKYIFASGGIIDNFEIFGWFEDVERQYAVGAACDVDDNTVGALLLVRNK